MMENSKAKLHAALLYHEEISNIHDHYPISVSPVQAPEETLWPLNQVYCSFDIQQASVMLVTDTIYSFLQSFFWASFQHLLLLIPRL